MKFVVISGLVLAACATQAQSPGFVIEGKLQGVPDKTRVAVVNMNRPTDTLAKAFVKGGSFVLKGRVTEPTLMDLTLSSTDRKTALFIGNETVTLSGPVAAFPAATVKGSATQDDFLDFQRRFNPLFGRLNSVSQLANSPEGASKRDSVEKAYYESVGAIQSQVDSFLAAKPASFVSPFLLVVVNQLSDNVQLLESRFDRLNASVQNGTFGKYLKEQIETGKIGAVGTKAIEFTQQDTAGRDVSLSSFKGKYVLVDFWASWCGPCRMENPNVLAAYNKFSNKNFTVLGVSLDRAREPWIKAINDDHLAWAQVSDLKFWSNDVAVKYHIQQIPQNLLVDPNGTIVGRNLRGAALDAKLCELLGCN